MWLRVPAAVALVLSASIAALHAQQQFQVILRLSNPTGDPVGTVTPATFRISEDGADAKVTKVDPVDWPLKLQILVDNGLGMGSENLGHVRQSLKTLIEGLPPTAHVTIVTTAPQPRFLVRSTNDRKEQLAGIDRLAPDSSSGFFVASLGEALDRISRDKSEHFPVILTIGTTVGDAEVRERDKNLIAKRLEEQRSTVVHVVIITSPGYSLGGGANQTDLGIAAAKMLRGRYENINNTLALGTVLHGFADQITKTFSAASGSYRLIVQRPSGKSGQLGKVSIAAGALIPSDVSVEVR
jgi:hypothetical protein